MLWWGKKSKTQLGIEALSTGALGETCAAEHYRELGFSILERNDFNRKGRRLGELDFVARKADTLRFVEVKTRSHESGRFGAPLESINKPKQRKLVLAVKSYMARHPDLHGLNIQIDACIVILPNLDTKPKSVTIYENCVEDLN